MSTTTVRQRRYLRPWWRLFRCIGMLALIPLLSFLGIPPTATALQSMPASTAISIGAGEYFSCKLMSDGAIICWGDNSYDKATPPAGQFAQLSVGVHHACATDRSGNAVCWGWNQHGQLGTSVMLNSHHYQQISAGWDRTCAIRDWGDLYCWGQGPNPPADDQSSGYQQVSVGVHHVCVVKGEAGDVICWGNNDFGEASVPAAAQTGIAAVSAGYEYTCALEQSALGGDVICWGKNSAGQAPALVSGPFVQVATGFSHACAIRANGSAVCWGSNLDGRATAPAGTFAQLSAGNAHSCAVRSNGASACWGDNGSGETTLIDLTPAQLPRALSGATYTQALAASGGAGGYTFALSQGSLPTGLSLSANGVLSGKPTGNGIYAFTISAADSQGHRGGRSFLLEVGGPLQDLLVPSDSARAIGFGAGVAIDGNRAVVTANVGYVYIFERAAAANQPWHETARLPIGLADRESPVVALSGDTLVIGQSGRANAECWHAYGEIYRYDLASPEGWRLEQTFDYGLIDYRNEGRGWMGLTVDGDTLVISNPGLDLDPYDPSEDLPPDLRVLRRGVIPSQPELWVETQTLHMPHDFHDSFALSGDTLAAVNGLTETAIFTRNAGSEQWSQTHILPIGGPPALSGDTLMIGDWQHDQVHVFRRNAGGANNWGEVAVIAQPSTVRGALVFGACIALDGNVAVIGAPTEYEGADPSWSVVYGRPPGSPDNWRPLLQLYKVSGARGLAGQTLLTDFNPSLDSNADQQRAGITVHWLQLASTLDVVAGDNQVRGVGALLNPPQVRVRDINGNPVPNFANVVFDGFGPGGSFVEPHYMDTAYVPTNSDGIATMSAYQAGQITGDYSITVRLKTNVTLDEKAIHFSVEVPQVGSVAGNDQHVPVGSLAPVTLRVTLSDPSGAPLEGLRVTFSAPGSGPGGSFADAGMSLAGAQSATVLSDAKGVATAPPFRASTVPGSYTITAEVEGVAKPITIAMTNDGRIYLPGVWNGR